MEAAKMATEGFISHLSIHQKNCKNTKDLSRVLLESLAVAHNSVISSKADPLDVGTTTLIGGTIFPVAGDDKDEFGVCIISIGDCKCFLWEAETETVRDITSGNRGNIIDARDCGGRLGPYSDGGMPDTRNLELFYSTCHTGDLLVFCSDGVHDNLDSASLGVDPGDLSEDLKGMATWKEASEKNKEVAEKVRKMFYEVRLGMLINEQIKGNNDNEDNDNHGRESIGNEEDEKRSKKDAKKTKRKKKGKDGKRETPKPVDVVDTLADYCLRTTYTSRWFMENNPTKRQPTDYKLYPGKMDHTTSVVIKVGDPTQSMKQ